MKLFFAALATLALATPQAEAVPVGADWTSNAGGTLDGVGFSITGLTVASIQTFDLGGADFSAAPLASNQQILAYETQSDWTVTFDSAIDDLRLYAVSWRGTSAGVDPVTYDFVQDFTVLSGLAANTGDADSIVVPATGFHTGIIEFAGPVTTLSVLTNSPSSGRQVLTFGVDTAPAPVIPLPAAAPLLLGGLAGLGLLARRRRTG